MQTLQMKKLDFFIKTTIWLARGCTFAALENQENLDSETRKGVFGKNYEHQKERV